MADFAIVTEIFYSGAWHNISPDVRNRDPVSIERGTRDESTNVKPGRLTFTLNNGRSNVNGAAVGRYTPRNPRSDLFGLIGRNTPVRQSINGHRRFTGEISEWPTRWELSGTEVWVGVQAYGILRRLGQGGGKPIVSAFKRRILEVGADAYWPLDAGELATIGEPLVGAHPFTYQGLFNALGLFNPLGGTFRSADDQHFAFGRSDLAPWLGSGLTFDFSSIPGPDDQASLRFEAPVEMSGAVEWTVEYHHRYTEGPATTNQLLGTANFVLTGLDLFGDGEPAQIWQILTGTSDLDGSPPDNTGPHITIVFPPNGANDFVRTGPRVGGPNNADGGLHHIHFRAKQNGADIDWVLTVNGAQALAGTVLSTTLQNIAKVQYEYVAFEPSPSLTIGHVAVRSRSGGPALASTFAAGVGHFAEPAGRRIERLCAEESIPFASVGVLDETELLGHQQQGPILTLFDQAADADGGILFEDREVAGLVYATLDSLYNRTPVLDLDYSAGHVSPPFEPTDDDQQLVNDATAKRIDGGERRFVQETGPLSITAPPVGVGRYDRQYTLNVTDDERLIQHAAARVAFGTFDESRFPEVGFRVLRHPELLADFVLVEQGESVTVANPPSWLPPEQIGLLVRGYRESYSRADWSAELWTIPSGLYLVGVLDIDRLDSDAATVASSFAAGTDTSLSVAFAAGAALAATGAASFQIRAAGVVLAVTNISGASSPQTFTVAQQPVNGVAKTIPAGAPVHLAKPWRLAK